MMKILVGLLIYLVLIYIGLKWLKKRVYDVTVGQLYDWNGKHEEGQVEPNPVILLYILQESGKCRVRIIGTSDEYTVEPWDLKEEVE